MGFNDCDGHLQDFKELLEDQAFQKPCGDCSFLLVFCMPCDRSVADTCNAHMIILLFTGGETYQRKMSRIMVFRCGHLVCISASYAPLMNGYLSFMAAFYARLSLKHGYCQRMTVFYEWLPLPYLHLSFLATYSVWPSLSFGHFLQKHRLRLSLDGHF